jgi:hypothetical protein
MLYLSKTFVYRFYKILLIEPTAEVKAESIGAPSVKEIGSQGSGGATIGKTIFACVYIEKIFSRTARPISIKLSTNHLWVKGILNCSNKGPDPLQRGDNHKNTKIW